MVEVGNIQITGEVEDSDIVAGLDRITDQLKSMEGQFAQVNPQMAKTAGIAKTLGKTLIGVGVAGLGAITAVATKSPALAGTFAQIEANTLKLSNTVGKQLKPIFDEVANDLIPSITKAFTDGDASVGSFVSTVQAGIGDISALLRGDLEEIDNFLLKTVLSAGGAIAGGTIAGPTGAVAGASLGYAAADPVAEVVNEIAEDTEILKERTRDTPLFLIGGFIDFITDVILRTGDKEHNFSSPTGVPRG